MAGFFSLSNPNDDDDNNNNHQIHESRYLYRSNEEIPANYYNKGFDYLSSSSAVGLGCDRSEGREYMMMNMMSGGGSVNNMASFSGAVTCQDCGNQAKKDCLHMRCRTCCKSHGFDCPTHVKSTWVPASVRRERHHKLAAAATTTHHPGEDQENGQPKRVRRGRGVSSSSSSLVCTQLPLTSSFSAGMEVGNLPSEVSSPAVFQCVRVSSMDDTEEEYAYQTAVSIGGHVFKGILYDQGPDHHHHPQGTSNYMVRGESSYVYHDSVDVRDPLHNLSAGPSTASTSSLVGGYLDPSMYPVPLSSYMNPGTQFFPNPRP